MNKSDDLDRRFVLCVGKAGNVIVRDKNVDRTQAEARKDFIEAMPVYSTATKDEAQSLIVFRCRLARDRSGVYSLNEFSGEVDDLDRVADMFRADHERMKSRAA